MKKIAFVCVGNTCRSPMAQYILEKMLKDNNINDIEVVSVGLSVVSSSKATENTIAVMNEIGIDIRDHRSQQVGAIIDSADVIYTLTTDYADILKLMFPDKAVKIIKISDFDIDDPYGGDLDTYRNCRDNIEKAVKEIYKFVI